MLSNLNRTPAVKHILIINIIVFALMNFSSLGQYYEIFALQYFDKPGFGLWQIITHMFQHARFTNPQGANDSMGIMHIVFNMFMLVQFGSLLEERWGTKRFVLFYFTAGLGSVLFFWLNQMGIFYSVLGTIFPVSETGFPPEYIADAVGASGAISGLVVAFAYLFPNTPLMLMFIPIPIKAKYLIGGFFAWDLLAGLSTTLTKAGVIDGYTDHIAHFAHLGGAVFGLVLLMYWQKSKNTFY